MIAMARQRNRNPLNVLQVDAILRSLRFSRATLREIAEENDVKIHQVDYLRRCASIRRAKQPHRCCKCGAKIETAECLKCHLQAVANGN